MKTVGPEPALVDSELLNALWKSVGWEPRSRYQWESYFDFVDFSYTTTVNDVPIGMGAGINDSPNCHIVGVCVHPAYKGRGIGTGIVTKLVETAKMRGYRNIMLVVPERNQGVREFYEKLGFQRQEGLSMGLRLHP